MKYQFDFQSGYTIAECLTVICMICICASFALPTYRELMIVNRISSVASDLHISLLYARSEAIKRGGNIVVCRSSSTLSENPQCDVGNAWDSTGWGVGWLIFHDVDRNRRYSTGDEILQAHASLYRESKDGGIFAIPAHNQITFNATGQVFGNYMRFQIRRPTNDNDISHDKYLCIASGGRIRRSGSACQR